MPSPWNAPRRVAVLCACLSLLLFGCSSKADPASPVPGGGLSQQEQSLTADEGEPGIVFPSCPKESAVFKLEFNHSWEFKPAGQGDLMTITGNTTPDAWCLIYVEGTRVEAEDCLIGYEYSGFLQTDDGKCDIQGASTALIEFEGECMDVEGQDEGVAEIYLVITEGPDPDADLSGALNCKHYSGPYPGFYPPSFSVMSFAIESQGSSQTDTMDETGQFTFTKQWRLIPANFPP